MKPNHIEFKAPFSVDESPVQLASENIRLQRLVAELLVRNQQLREQLEFARHLEANHTSTPA